MNVYIRVHVCIRSKDKQTHVLWHPINIDMSNSIMHFPCVSFYKTVRNVKFWLLINNATKHCVWSMRFHAQSGMYFRALLTSAGHEFKWDLRKAYSRNTAQGEYLPSLSIRKKWGATTMESGPQYIYIFQSFVFSRENYKLSTVLSVLSCYITCIAYTFHINGI